MRAKCICCSKDTFGHCGKDSICFDCYKSHRYLKYLNKKKVVKQSKKFMEEENGF